MASKKNRYSLDKSILDCLLPCRLAVGEELAGIEWFFVAIRSICDFSYFRALSPYRTQMKCLANFPHIASVEIIPLLGLM